MAAKGDSLIKAGYKIARTLTRIHARTFYFASLFLTAAQKPAVYSVYAICRRSDDIVDTEGNSDRKKDLAAMENKITHAYSNEPLPDPLLAAFRHTVHEYAIPKSYFDELLKGMAMDLEKPRYENFQELSLYCYRVAGVIGLIILKIFKTDTPEAEPPAIALGIAMQLTNILRDIREDYLKKRIYVPQDELRRFGVTETQLAQHTVDNNFIALMRFQIDRAHEYYRQSAEGVKLIKAARDRYVAGIMKEAYEKILDEIELKNYDIFSQKVFVPLRKKIMTALRLLGKETWA